MPSHASPAVLATVRVSSCSSADGEEDADDDEEDDDDEEEDDDGDDDVDSDDVAAIDIVPMTRSDGEFS